MEGREMLERGRKRGREERSEMREEERGRGGER